MHKYIGIWDKFCSGGLRSLDQIVSTALARKSSGFSQILPFFAQTWPFEKILGGAAAPLALLAHTPMFMHAHKVLLLHL